MLNSEFKIIDLFAGGFGLGFKMAGYNVTHSLEADQWACDTLRENCPGQHILHEDIRKYQTAQDIRSVCPILPDVIIGGPPCQGFSIAGPATKDPKDPRNTLFLEFARWVECLQPSIFVMENVKGLLARRNAQNEKVIEIIKRSFADLDYKVEIWILNAAQYGVPQNRERIFIVGDRLGLDMAPPPPTHTLSNIDSDPQLVLFDTDRMQSMITLWDAISDLPELQAGQGEEIQEYVTPPQNGYQQQIRDRQNTLFNHVAMNHSKRLVERFKHVGWGESGANVPTEHMPRQRNGNGKLSAQAYDQNNRRLHPYRPSHTIAASFYANFIHPFQHRNLTAREGARLQSFPDSYRFMGKKTTPSHKLLEREGRLDEKHLCQYNQIGNAVPPLLAKAVASHIREILEKISIRRVK